MLLGLWVTGLIVDFWVSSAMRIGFILEMINYNPVLKIWSWEDLRSSIKYINQGTRRGKQSLLCFAPLGRVLPR